MQQVCIPHGWAYGFTLRNGAWLRLAGRAPAVTRIPKGCRESHFFKVRNFPQHTVSKRKLRSLKKKIIAVLKENSESDYSSSIMCETTLVHEPEMGAGGGESREGHSLSDPDSQRCQIEAGG